MKHVKQIYQERKADFKLQKKKVQKTLLIFSLLRLTVFAISICIAYVLWGNPKWVGLTIIVGILSFVLLIKLFTKAKYQKQKLEALIEINEIELKTNLSNFNYFPDGENYQNDQHAFSQDTDLFGQKSFFQYLNRTQLAEGEKCLANKLQQNDVDAIPEKQALVKEMADKIDFRQEFAAHAKLLNTEEKITNILSWLTNYKSHVPKFTRWFPYAFSLLSVIVISLFFIEIINLKQFLIWLFISLGITGFFMKKTNALSNFAGKAQASFQQYGKLLRLIESTTFSSPKSKAFQQEIIQDNTKFSATLHQFSKQIDNLEQRNNMLLGVVINGFFLWDVMQSYKIEKWIKKHHQKVENVFQLVAEFDAWCSFGNFSFNHQDYVFPEINHQAESQLFGE